MKPILLEMTAFGSYAKKTVVDFERLTHGLYLITGDTGAGKTTIFDAIMFALYGVASGPDRKTAMMHCDFVEKSVDTEVTLHFRQGGRTYAVTRTIHYPKKRGTENEYGDGYLDAVMWEPDSDGEPIEGITNVTNRCTELLGLNAGQFRKIVMLAQGEFKRFLAADPEEKNAILGQIFDNFAYIRYQNLLKGARDALRVKREEQTGQVANAMQKVFQMPEGLEDEEKNLYLPEHPELLDNLNKLLEDEQQALKELERKREAVHSQEKVLIEQKGAADGQNQLLDELAAKQKRLTELEAQAGTMARLQTECDTVERALRQVQPKRDLLAAAEKTLRDTGREIEQLQADLQAQEEAVRTAQTAVDADGETVRELEALAAELQLLENTLPQYEELDKAQREKQKAASAAEKLRAQKSSTETQLAQKKTLLADITKEQTVYADIDAQVVRLENDYTQARKNTEALMGKTGVQRRVEQVFQDQAELNVQETRLRTLEQAALEAEQHHHRLYQAFIGGQAGLLAEELRQELQHQENAVCPVCRSTFRAGQDHEFAPLLAETPSQEDVDKARQAYDQKEKSRRTKDGDVTALRLAVETEQGSILRDVQLLFPDCGSWEALTANEYLPQKARALRQAEADSKRAWEEAREKQKRSTELVKQRQQTEEQLAALEEALKRAGEEQTAYTLAAEKWDSVISTLRSQLQYPTKEAADQQLQRQKERRNSLKTQVDRHQQLLQTAKDRRTLCSGKLTGKQESLPGLEQARVDAAQALQTAVTENGFSSLEDVDRVLLAPDGRRGEDWLKQQRNVLTAHRHELSSTQNRIQELTAQTKDVTYTDLSLLQEEIDQVAGEYRTVNEAYIKLKQRIGLDTTVLGQVSKAKTLLKKTDGAWRRLDLLANLAIGVSGDGGKLSFDRYVMGTVFREILEMANQRLNVMSGGRYELLHQINAGRKNAKAGLEVEVLDMKTGKQRNSNSLSGGESFLVSLSLALGLSDVVQHHAGGRQLDAMFIDEGFGSLDGTTLDTALSVLQQLTEGNCLVGIISHVGRLEESIPQKIRVKSTAQGSFLWQE